MKCCGDAVHVSSSCLLLLLLLFFIVVVVLNVMNFGADGSIDDIFIYC